VAPDGGRGLFALGVGPAHRRAGLATRLLAACPADWAEVTLAERDPFEPLDVAVRAEIGRRLLAGAGFAVHSAGGPVASVDPTAVVATRPSTQGRQL
jgi:hypothetical protein